MDWNAEETREGLQDIGDRDAAQQQEQREKQLHGELLGGPPRVCRAELVKPPEDFYMGTKEGHRQ